MTQKCSRLVAAKSLMNNGKKGLKLLIECWLVVPNFQEKDYDDVMGVKNLHAQGKSVARRLSPAPR